MSSGGHGDLLGMEGGHHVPPYANTGALMTTIDTTSGLPSVAHTTAPTRVARRGG